MVTGAASGIGRALSIELAREGCDVAIGDLNEAGLIETAREVQALGRKASVHLVDVADRARMQRFAAEVVQAHGKVNLLVNNAGVGVGKSFEQQTFEDWEWILGVNLWGVIHGVKFFLPHLREVDDAHIVNLSSLFGLVPVPLLGSYCATKAAVGALSETLWMELRKHQIAVTAVYPGGVVTNVARASRYDDAATRAFLVSVIDKFSITPERCAKRIVKGIKQGRSRLVVTPVAHTMESIGRLAPNFWRGVFEYGLRRAQATAAKAE